MGDAPEDGKSVSGKGFYFVEKDVSIITVIAVLVRFVDSADRGFGKEGSTFVRKSEYVLFVDGASKGWSLWPWLMRGGIIPGRNFFGDIRGSEGAFNLFLRGELSYQGRILLERGRGSMLAVRTHPRVLD